MTVVPVTKTAKTKTALSEAEMQAFAARLNGELIREGSFGIRGAQHWGEWMVG